MKDDFIKPIIILTLICLVVSGALAVLNDLTYPVIQAAAAERAQTVMNSIIPASSGFELISDDRFPATVREAYRETGGKGYVFIVSVNGYGGEVRVICGIDMDGRIIQSSTLAQTETKGLGTIIAEDWWTSQFDDKDSSLEGISTISGATISTRAFINAINDAFAAYEAVRG